MYRLLFILLGFVLLPLSFLIASKMKAPEFTFPTPAGDSSFSALLKTNKIALIYFGNDSQQSWKALLELDALFSEYKYRESNLEVLAFIPGKKSDELEKLAEEHWLNISLVPDLNEKIAQSFNVKEYPAMAIVDSFGNIQIQGKVPSKNELRKKLNDYVDKPVVKAFCPVDKMWLVVTDKTPSVIYKGNRYYFCSSEDHDGRKMDQEFIQDPDRYVKEALLYIKNEKAIIQPKKTKTPVKYQCPMKDFPIQNKPGTCPNCRMLLQKIQN